MMPIDPAGLDPDPLRQLRAWLAEAVEAGVPMPDAMALATASADGAPSVRMVLLRGLEPDGLRFYTNRSSRKGRDLAANGRAAGVIHWASLGRQVRVAGVVDAMSTEESTPYWSERPRGSRLAAWASVQGAPIDSREAMEARYAEMDDQFPGESVPLPPFWGGYRLVPDVYEFWESRENRLHDRVEYLDNGNGGWRRRRLQP
jgi:pyridoxamine 5'-phosphate oxidase